MIRKDLLNVLVCPQCKKSIEFDENKNILVCRNCRLKYNIVDGIPNMLLEDAEKF